MSDVAEKVRHVKRAPQDRRHRCHAEGCKQQVPPAMFMCRRHWFTVPKALRDDIWRLYRVGQENDQNPSGEYLRAASSAIQAVAEKEGKR